MTIKTAPLPPDAKMRMIPSYLGYLGIIACFVAPKETYVSVDMAMKVMQLVYGLFFTLFMFMPAMFFKDNFVKAPKDNFGELFLSEETAHTPSAYNGTASTEGPARQRKTQTHTLTRVCD